MFRSFTLMFAATVFSAQVLAQSPMLDPCPFTPAELSEVLGTAFEAGVADEPLVAGTLTIKSCRYKSKHYSLSVNSTTYERAGDASTHISGLAGTKIPVSGDPDGAVYQEGQGDNTDPAVAYLRQGTVMELRILGGYYDDPSSKEATMKALREKLAKLRRVP